MLMTSIEMKADVDPNFYIYICFGQSNMEGNAQWESQDVGNVDPRFQMLATCNFSSPSRTLGNWYTATCPIVSPDGKLGPTDYFGRTMVANLPDDHRVGVIAVAMGGSPIEMFDKDLYQQKMADNPNEWWVTLAKRHYGGNPYGRIIEMAKKAQQVGVIKGTASGIGPHVVADQRTDGDAVKIKSAQRGGCKIRDLTGIGWCEGSTCLDDLAVKPQVVAVFVINADLVVAFAVFFLETSSQRKTYVFFFCAGGDLC